MRLFCVANTGSVSSSLPVTPARVSLPRPRRSLRHGNRKWFPRAISEADLNRGRILLEKWGPDHKNRDRVISDYELVCHLSGYETKNPLAHIGFLGQLANSGLSPGTSDTYIGYVHKRHRMTNVTKAASARHADHEARHAPDLPDDVLWRYVQEASPRWAPIFWLLYTAGLRPVALRYLSRRRISVPNDWKKEELEVSVRIDKTRKKKALRAILLLPKSWKWIRPPPSDDAATFLREGDREEKLFEFATATAINLELRKMSQRLGIARPTSYSFRRSFVNRILPLVRNKAELTSYTLHFKKDTIDAFYRRTKDDERKMLS